MGPDKKPLVALLGGIRDKNYDGSRGWWVIQDFWPSQVIFGQVSFLDVFMAFGILSGCDGCILFYIFLPLGIQITVPGSHVDYGPTDEKVTNGAHAHPRGYGRAGA